MSEVRIGNTEEKTLFMMYYERPLYEKEIRNGLKRKSSVYTEINRLIKKGLIENSSTWVKGRKYHVVSMKCVDYINKSFDQKKEDMRQLKEWLKRSNAETKS